MTKEKEFDAVKMMREIRDEISRKFMNMSREEQRLYVANQLKRSESSLRTHRVHS